MLIPHNTLVAVADGEKLELYRNTGTETGLRLAALPTPELDAHSKEAGSRHRSSPANPSRHLLAEDSFAAAVADWLNRQAIEGAVERVVVIAAPRVLGEMRRHYHGALKERLLAELSKELTGQPVAAIERELTLPHAG